jgi:hypothetical protein
MLCCTISFCTLSFKVTKLLGHLKSRKYREALKGFHFAYSAPHKQNMVFHTHTQTRVFRIFRLKLKLDWMIIKIHFLPQRRQCIYLHYKGQLGNAVREMIAVYSENHKKHISTLCGHNVELLIVKQVVHIVTTGLLNG